MIVLGALAVFLICLGILFEDVFHFDGGVGPSILTGAGLGALFVLPIVAVIR